MSWGMKNRILSWIWSLSCAISMPSVFMFIWNNLPHPLDWLRILFIVMIVISLIPNAILLHKMMDKGDIFAASPNK
jgi:hypothetical protein